MIVINKITEKSFKTKEEYQQFLRLAGKSRIKDELNYASLRLDKIKELTGKKKSPKDYKELKSELFCLGQCLNWLKSNI